MQEVHPSVGPGVPSACVVVQATFGAHCEDFGKVDPNHQSPDVRAQEHQGLYQSVTIQGSPTKHNTHQPTERQPSSDTNGRTFRIAQLVFGYNQSTGALGDDRGSEASPPNRPLGSQGNRVCITSSTGHPDSSAFLTLLASGGEDGSSAQPSNQPCQNVHTPGVDYLYEREGQLWPSGEDDRRRPAHGGGTAVGEGEETRGTPGSVLSDICAGLNNTQSLRQDPIGSLVQERSLPSGGQSRSAGRRPYDLDRPQVDKGVTAIHRTGVHGEASSDGASGKDTSTQGPDLDEEPYPPLPPYPPNEEDLLSPPPLPRDPLAQLSLDPITVPPIDIDELIRMEADLERVLRVLRSEDDFCKLLKEDATLPTATSPSRVPGNWEKDLIGWGVASYCNPHQPKAILSAFTVPKSADAVRLIINAAPLNECMQRPPHFSLPSVQQLKEKVFLYALGQTVDLRHCFYQFSVSGGVEDYFCVRARRGRVLSFQRMAMGWSWAPYIAQSVALAYLRPILPHAVAVYDDFLVLGDDEQQTESRAATVRSRITRCGGTLHATKSMTSPATIFVYMGIEWDLENKRFRLSPSFVAKWSPWLNKLPSEQLGSLHLLYSVVAAILYALRIWDEPACYYFEITRWVSQISASIGNGHRTWQDRASFPQKVWAEVLTLSTRLSSNPWCTWQAGPPTSPTQIYSDASSCGWAWITYQGGILEGRCGPAPVAMHINVLELWALWQAIRIVAQRSPGLAWIAWCDNLVVVHQVRRRRSPSFWPNFILRALCKLLKDTGSRLQVNWISTTEQLADRFTRLDAFDPPATTDMESLPMDTEGQYLDIPGDVAFGQ
jgi:hypothetical protein